MAQKGISFKPSTFVHGGGLLDDVDVTIKECRFCTYDYDGTIQNPVLALGVELEVEGEDKTHTEYFSAGDLKFFVPSKDGKQALPVGKKEGLGDSTNAATFIGSIVSAGFPEDKLEDDISVFEGMLVHINRVAQAKRENIANQDPKKNKTVLTVTKIHRLPWEKAGKAKAAAGGKANGKAKDEPAEEAGDDPIAELATATIMEILSEGEVTKKDLSKKVFAALKDSKERNKVVAIAFKDEFLANGPWQYDGTTLSMG